MKQPLWHGCRLLGSAPRAPHWQASRRLTRIRTPAPAGCEARARAIGVFNRVWRWLQLRIVVIAAASVGARCPLPPLLRLK